MLNFTINFLQESEARIRGIYTCVMIPTFKTKFKHIFGACIKKKFENISNHQILLDACVCVYLCNLDQG